MEVAMLIHAQKIAEGAFGGFDDRISDSLEFIFDHLVLDRYTAQSAQHDLCLVIFAFQNQPSRAFRQAHHQGQNGYAEDDLESNWKAPRNRIGVCEVETKVNPCEGRQYTALV
jgi:hypothetical protein